MNKYFSTLVLVLSFLFSEAQKLKLQRPSLVVGIVIDQMRPDYLYRYGERFGPKGFARLMDGGNVCENTFINYLPSYTGPGHACIYTGSVPSLHGISSNDWLDKMSGKAVYCTEDAGAHAVGGTQRAGRMSPKNLWAGTITDELRLSSNFRSKVIAISVKDRGAILPGGHSANASYWMDDSNAVFMSSDYYLKDLPEWVKQFNGREIAKKYMQGNWNTVYPPATYVQSGEDSNPYEGKFAGETASTFPHKTADLRVIDIKRTPFGNDIVADFAKEAILNEKLGQGTETDFLAVSFSSSDYIGHMYGPSSVEVEDCYLRLDKNIASLLEYLDQQVGEGNYTVFLTSDHGVAHNPQYLIDHKIPAGFFFGNALCDQLNQGLYSKFGKEKIIQQIAENFIWLNDSVLEAGKLNRQSVIQEILDKLKPFNEIQYAVDMQKLHHNNLPAKLKEMASNGFVSRRSGDILLLLNPGWLDAYSKTGTTHGTWNPYDTHIPLLWYGWGIRKGITRREVYMTDIAATLATLLHIQMPNACIGKTIDEVLK